MRFQPDTDDPNVICLFAFKAAWREDARYRSCSNCFSRSSITNAVCDRLCGSIAITAPAAITHLHTIKPVETPRGTSDFRTTASARI
jgi:hypothetical protein